MSAATLHTNHGPIEIELHEEDAPKTVANHISSIFSKLQVTDRSEAIVRAREQGLGRRG